MDYTCSLSGSTTISYDIQSNNGNQVPGWVSLDPTNKLLNFTTPSVSEDTNYTFNIASSASGDDYFISIYIEVLNSPDTEDTEDEMILSIESTQTATQVAAGTGIGIACTTSLFSGSSPQAAWIMMNQIQLLLLLPILVDYMHHDVANFIFGMENFSFSLNFIPVKKIKEVKQMFEAISFEQENQGLKNIGLEYETTLSNIFSTLLLFLVLISIHLLVLWLHLLAKAK
jgi:hypothetical protein